MAIFLIAYSVLALGDVEHPRCRANGIQLYGISMMWTPEALEGLYVESRIIEHCLQQDTHK